MSRTLGLALAAALVCAACSSQDTDDDGAKTAARDPLKPYPATGETKTFDLTAAELDWEVGPGAIYDGIAYNGQIPGPPIEVNAGDHVVVHLTNKTKEPRSVHTHVVKFTNGNDGTDPDLAAPGETKTYEWTPSTRARSPITTTGPRATA